VQLITSGDIVSFVRFHPITDVLLVFLPDRGLTVPVVRNGKEPEKNMPTNMMMRIPAEIIPAKVRYFFFMKTPV
jgi:hypothetical protein